MASQEKIIEKEWNKISKTIFGKNNWKRSSWANFQQKSDFLYSFSCMKVSKKNEVVIDLKFKPADIDLLFWEIVNLPNNKDEPLSLRVIGAWALRGIPITSWIEIVNPDNPEIAFETILKKVNQNLKSIEHISDINSFIDYLETCPESPIIMPMLVTCLIKTNQLYKAMTLVEKEIENKASGGFEYDHRTYFQLARDEILKKNRQAKVEAKFQKFRNLFSRKKKN